MEKPVGLFNQGATCYLNSFLQTLFHIHSFRRHLHSFKIKAEHGPASECINQQLLRLLCLTESGKFQTVDTKQLTKSFSWKQGQSWVQHDLNQFSKQLYLAYDSTMLQGGEPAWLQGLFRGVLLNIIECCGCSNKSQREESFVDLFLIIQDQNDLSYNNSVRLALQKFIKPTQLSGDNSYSCPVCSSKQVAKRYSRLAQTPSILNLTLGRFSLDYATMSKVKVNAKMKVEVLLDVTDYLGSYEQIPQKLQQLKLKAKKVTSKKPLKARPKKDDSSQRLKEQLQNSLTKFVQELPFLTSVEQIIGHAEIVQLSDGQVLYNQSENSQHLFFILEGCILLKSSRPAMLSKGCFGLQALLSGTRPCSAQAQRAGRVLKIEGRRLIQSSQTSREEIEQWIRCQNQHLLQSQQSQFKELQGRAYQLHNKGRIVYLLFSVICHSGSADYGHYRAFIRRSDQWFQFNDAKIRPVALDEVLRVSEGRGGESAYSLFYQRVGIQKSQMERSDLFDIFVEEEEQRRRQMQEQERKRSPQYSVFYQTSHKKVDFCEDYSLAIFKNLIKQVFAIPQKIALIRVGEMKADSEQMIRTFSLDQVSIKQQGITPQIKLFVQVLDSSEKLQLNLFFLNKEQSKLVEVFKEEPLASQLQLQGDWIAYRKSFQANVLQILDLGESAEALSIRNRTDIYLQEQVHKGQWPKAYLASLEQVVIKFNCPGQAQQTRETRVLLTSRLQDVKAKICNQNGLSSKDIIMRKGNHLGLQIKNLQLSVKKLGISFIFLEEGQPCPNDCIRLFLFKTAVKINTQTLSQFLFMSLGSVIVSPQVSLPQLKQICRQYMQLKNQPMQHFRLREKVSETKAGRIYKLSKGLKQQQIVDNKAIAIEECLQSQSCQSTQQILIEVIYPAAEKSEQLIVKRTSTLLQLKALLSLAFALEQEQLSVAKYASTPTFINLDSQAYVTSAPLFLTEATALLVKAGVCETRAIRKGTKTVRKQKEKGVQIKRVM